MLILVVLLLWFICYILLLLHVELLRTTTNTCATGYRCLSVAAVAPRLNMTTLVAAPFGMAVVA